MKSERRLKRDGSEVVYTVEGQGPAVVLGHSLFCQRSMWSGVVSRLRETFTLINVGLRGHGESTATAPFELWDLADDWVAILDEEEIEKAALCGLSTGGMTAMRFAVRYPDRACGLAVIDSDSNREASVWKRFQYSALGALYQRTGIIPTRTLAKALFGPNASAAMIAELIALMKSFDRTQLAHAMKAVFGRDRVDVSTLTLPTLVVVGENDHATPADRSRDIAAAIEGSRLEILEGVGHLSAIEVPNDLADLLGPFLGNCFES